MSFSNEFQVDRISQDTTAQPGQHIIGDGQTVTLPSPSKGDTILVSSEGSRVSVTTSSTIEGQYSTVRVNGDTVSFISDGSNWFILNGSENVNAIPDSGGTHQYNATAGSGTTLTDSIGSLNGSINGATWKSEAGAKDAYLDYDGTDDRTEITGSASDLGHFINGHGTLFAWIKPTADQYGNFLDSGGIGTGNSGLVGITRQSDGSLRTTANNQNGDGMWDISPSDKLSQNWRAVAMTADGSKARLFKTDSNDTVSQIGSESISNTQPDKDLKNDLHLGYDSDNSGNQFAGGIDIVWTDSVAQSQSNIQLFVDGSKQFY